MGKRQSAGEGSVYQRQSDGRWVVQFRDLQGRTRHRYRDPRGRRLENKTHARQALRAYLQQRGEGVGGDDPRLAEWTAWWLAQLDLRPTTIADYRYKIGLLPDWLTRKRLAQITRWTCTRPSPSWPPRRPFTASLVPARRWRRSARFSGTVCTWRNATGT
jgi:hypothetical protein